jgi:multidrug efflux pump subunit AcrA (membrane-fusion protein)
LVRRHRSTERDDGLDTINAEVESLAARLVAASSAVSVTGRVGVEPGASNARTGRVGVEMRDQNENALSVGPRLLVPRRALRSDAGQDVVFVVRDGLAERRPVRIGTSEGDHVEIQSGLNAGDRIVVEAPDNLTDKTRVQEASVR